MQKLLSQCVILSLFEVNATWSCGRSNSHSMLYIPSTLNHGQSSYWTAKSSFFFLTSDHTEAENLGPKLHPGGGFFGP